MYTRKGTKARRVSTPS